MLKIKTMVKTLLLALIFHSIVTIGYVYATGAESKREHVIIGVYSKSDEQVWNIVSSLAKEEGIDLEVRVIPNFNKLNTDVRDGILDMNAFQHQTFLEHWNDNNKGRLVDIGSTYYSTLGLYSRRINYLGDVTDGTTVAIPNDVVGKSRALQDLEKLKLIELPNNKDYYTLKDVRYIVKLKIDELDELNIKDSVYNYDLAMVPNNYVQDVGMGIKNSLYDDDGKTNSIGNYRNKIVINRYNKHKEVYSKIVSLYQSEPVKEELLKLGLQPAWSSKDTKSKEDLMRRRNEVDNKNVVNTDDSQINELLSNPKINYMQLFYIGLAVVIALSLIEGHEQISHNKKRGC